MTREWIETQRRHFDRELGRYSVMYGAETPFHQAMTGRLIQFAGPREAERVLDLGCGVGRVTIPLLRLGCRVTGLDISEATLDALSERVRRLGFADRFRAVNLAAERLDDRQRFDLVVGRGFLHHLQDPVAVLVRVRSALVPGGRAVFMDPNPLQMAWLPFHLFHPALSLWVERYLWRGFPAWTRRSMRRAGFNDVEGEFSGLVLPQLWGRLSQAADIERWLISVPGLRELALYFLVRGERSPGVA